MPLIKTIPCTDGLISIWQLTETSEQLMSLFSDEELADEYFQKFSFEKRKTEWLATRALLKQTIGNEFIISYLASGRPVLNHSIYHHISISHSREFVVIYIHQNKPIGIDIESMDRNYAPVMKKYLSQPELNLAHENVLIPCLYWSAKEALFKLVEEEGIDFRRQFEIIAFEPSCKQLTARYISDQTEKTYQLNYITLNNHCLVWVMNEPISS